MTFAVIRQKQQGAEPTSALPPALVMHVERVTPQFLVGRIMTPEGKEERVRLGFYDRRPDHFVAKPGKVDRDRLVAEFPDFFRAKTALAAMRAAWEAVSTEAVVDAQAEVVEARSARDEAIRLARLEVAEKVAPKERALLSAISKLSDANAHVAAARNQAMTLTLAPEDRGQADAA